MSVGATGRIELRTGGVKTMGPISSRKTDFGGQREAVVDIRKRQKLFCWRRERERFELHVMGWTAARCRRGPFG